MTTTPTLVDSITFINNYDKTQQKAMLRTTFTKWVATQMGIHSSMQAQIAAGEIIKTLVENKIVELLFVSTNGGKTYGGDKRHTNNALRVTTHTEGK